MLVKFTLKGHKGEVESREVSYWFFTLLRVHDVMSANGIINSKIHQER